MKTKALVTCCLLALVLRAHGQVAASATGQAGNDAPAQTTGDGSAQASTTEGTHAGYVPVVAGSLGYVYTVQGGVPTLSPQINPVLLAAFGRHVLFETRTDFTGFFNRRDGTNGDYTGKVYKTVEFVQVDWLANTHVMPVLGRYLMPFGLYPERVTPLWIANIQDYPIDFAIGTRTTGTGVGPQFRGVAVEKPAFNIQYSAYYSVHYNQDQLGAPRAAGGDASIYFKDQRAEFGSSYQRFLDNRPINNEAAYLAWQPFQSTDLDLKAQYSRSYYGQGYWIEGYDMLAWAPVATRFFSRMQVVGRAEESF
ncbi:MAG: hypothetical protein WBP85_07925, partial [Terracidiphilus sp.]